MNDDEILKNIIESLKKIREKEKKISFLKKKIEEVKSKEVKKKILELIEFLHRVNSRNQMENELGGVLLIEEEGGIEGIVKAEEKVPQRVEEQSQTKDKIEEYISKERMKPIDYFGRFEEQKEEVGGYLRIEESEKKEGEQERYSETTPVLKIDLETLWPRASPKNEIEEMQSKIKGELIRKYRPKLRIEED